MDRLRSVVEDTTSSVKSMTVEVEKTYGQAVSQGLKLIEQEARRILRSNRKYEEFIMAMGMAMFTEKGGGESLEIDDVPEAEELSNFMYKWDEYLKLTGNPMRFTAKGRIVTSWK